MRKKILSLFLTAAMLVSFVPFTLTASAALADDNTLMFSANDDADGKLYYTSYNWGINGLGGTQAGMLKNSTGTAYTSDSSSAYLFADEIAGENMWKIDFNADENGNHVKEKGGGTYIYPFYSALKKDGSDIPNEDIESLADNFANAEEYTHLAIRVKLIDDGTGRAVKSATHSFSMNLLAAGGTDGNYGRWKEHGGVYLIDINTGAKTKVSASTSIPLGFDGYVVYPSNAVVDKVDGSTTYTTLADLVKIHIMTHWNCSHSYTSKDTDNWVGTELYIGDMILTKNIESFNAVYTSPAFELTSNDTSVTVISDDTKALYSLNKDADISSWLAKDAFNATLKSLKKGTKYTVYAKYANGARLTTREISTTATGVEGYLMKVPEKETSYHYNSKYVSWGTGLAMAANQDPFSQSATYDTPGRLYGRKSGDDYFIVFNPDETYNTNGTIKERNIIIYHNTISGRGLDDEGNPKKGMPEGVDPENIEALAVRFKIVGGTPTQYSSLSMLVGGYIPFTSGYFIDNVTGRVMKPNDIDYTRFGVKGEFDGWLVIPYESLYTANRRKLETGGDGIQFYFHTSACSNADHGKDTSSDWTNKAFLLGDIALVSNEDDFIRTYANHKATNGGMLFSRNDAPFVEGKYTEMINTFEATIQLPENFPASIRAGVMYGSYGGQNKGLNFEIFTNGNPRVFYQTETKANASEAKSKLFTEVNLLNGKKTHIAIVNDQLADTISCYVDGVLAQTLDGAIPDWIPTRPGVIGGDYRNVNSLAFCGEMFDVALYSDVRTSDEIAADMTTVGTDNLMAHWDLTRPAVDGKLIDQSGNGHNAVLGKYWFTEKEPVTDYDYSFAIVGDTQIVNIDYPDRLSNIYEWIVANKDSKNIQYVMGLGDVTDKDKSEEWTNADADIAMLDSVVPYSLVRGNHDGTELFNSTFDKAPYNTTFKEKYKVLENTYRELVVGDIRYLIFTLDVGAGDDVLEWAGNIIKNHPEHNVIITTHVYLDAEGNYMTSDHYYRATKYGGTNNGDDMWEKLISKYENITMVFSGHISQGLAVLNQDTGVNGNVVSQFLIDPQGVDSNLGATGMVTMLYFSEDGSKVKVETLSTVRNKYYLTHGQYEFDVNVIKHTHKGGKATCNTKAVCDYCKEPYGDFDLTQHNYSDASCTEPMICTRCNATSGSALGHDYSDATCTAPKTCKVCGGTEGSALGHDYKAATCTAPKTCKVCKATSGSALGHDYKAATCTAPKTCKVCKATSGKALGHKYTKVTTKAATTSKNGYVLTECSVCGKDKSKTTIYSAKTIKLSYTSYTYNGKTKKPSVTVKDSKGKTISSKYYTVTYASGRKNVGKYKVTVKFKGNYSGTKTLYFEINPGKTTLKKVTGASKSIKVYVNKKTTQVSGYQIQYSTSKKFTSAKTKTITSSKTTSTTIKSLKAKKTYYVRVRTYKTVSGKRYYSGWSSYKSAKTK